MWVLVMYLTADTKTDQNEPAVTPPQSEVISLFREMGLFGSYTPKGEDPIWFPIQLMSEAQFLVGTRKYKKGHEKPLADRLTPHDETIRKVQLAYEVIAYPALERSPYSMALRELITDAEENPGRDIAENPHRGPITLNDEQMAVLAVLTTDRGLPFSPEKRVYSFTEHSARKAAEAQATMRAAWRFTENAINAGQLIPRSEIEEEIRQRQAQWLDHPDNTGRKPIKSPKTEE